VAFDHGWYQARWRQFRSIAGLVAITWSVLTARPWAPPPLAALVLAVGGWLVRLLFERQPRLVVAGTSLSALGGVVLSTTNPRSAALGYVAAACVAAGARLPWRWSAPLVTLVGVAQTAGHLVLHRPFIWHVVTAVGVAACWLAGVVRRQAEDRAEQAQLLVAETRLAQQEQARAAALAERARIAREIHDVLAHALAALSVQLETADALLEGGRTGQARATLGRARQLTREGLAETRRAIGALRGDTLPLPELLSGLTEGYAADAGAAVQSTVDGPVRDLPPDVTLALYRTAQEALTNVRKHAPGASVTVRLCYAPEAVRLTVLSEGGSTAAPDPEPSGYGLTGLRERAELAGGTFEAGPDRTGWRVDVRIPA